MAINPDNIDVVTIPQLENVTLALDRLFPHAATNGQLGKATINELANFIAPYVASIGASEYIEVSGSVLPNPTVTNGFTFVPSGDYTQSAGPTLSPVGFLNILTLAGDVWSVTKEILIDFSNYVTKEYFDSSLGGFTEKISETNLTFNPSFNTSSSPDFNLLSSKLMNAGSAIQLKINAIEDGVIICIFCKKLSGGEKYHILNSVA